jgi:hypothetical protein
MVGVEHPEFIVKRALELTAKVTDSPLLGVENAGGLIEERLALGSRKSGCPSLSWRVTIRAGSTEARQPSSRINQGSAATPSNQGRSKTSGHGSSRTTAMGTCSVATRKWQPSRGQCPPRRQNVYCVYLNMGGRPCQAICRHLRLPCDFIFGMLRHSAARSYPASSFAALARVGAAGTMDVASG